jgi:hypothetical protein
MHVLAAQDGQGHHPEGRIIICEFPSGLTVLSTYAPNNGNKAESFKRRQDWDKSLNEWVTSKKEEGKKVIWMGGESPPCVSVCGNVCGYSRTGMFSNLTLPTVPFLFRC